MLVILHIYRYMNQPLFSPTIIQLWQCMLVLVNAPGVAVTISGVMVGHSVSTLNQEDRWVAPGFLSVILWTCTGLLLSND